MTHRGSPGRASFVAGIGLSAFLLFSLELLGGRLVLPVFGGAPAVWTTSLSFFTAVLFVGYLYADLVGLRLSQRTGGRVQLVITAAAVLLTVVAPADVATLRIPGLAPALNVLVVLVVIAGAPAFLLATTTPLLSAWYAGRGGDPWWLYATSNAASFGALIAYPLLFEPNVPLSGQRWLLAAGLGLFGLILFIVVRGARRDRPDGPTIAAGRDAPNDGVVGTSTADRRGPPTARRQLLWLIAAAVPAGLLSAITNYLQTDLISAPLIWIGPLGIYLASFVVAFSGRGRRALPFVDRLVPAAATLLWIPYIESTGWPVVPLLVVELGAFFVLAIAIHGRLALDRPDERHLTRFYLALSAGGLVATAFVALAAPVIFSTVYEYPLLVVAGLVILTVLPGAVRTAGRRDPAAAFRRLVARLLPYVAVSVALYLLLDRADAGTAAGVLRLLVFGAIVVAAAIDLRVVAGATAVVLVLLVGITPSADLLRVRTFFGVITVRAGDSTHQEISGTTLHGVQFTDTRRSEPTTYYARSGPLGSVFTDLRATRPNARIGVVGLGVGTIAAYSQAGDELTFYEIDQAVVDIARDPAYFTFLADAPVRPGVVVGDGLLSLQDAPPGSFDLLVLDAFSSDSVPAHLLTREAIAVYERTLRPGGVLAFHLSNRYYDLAGAVGATARSDGLTVAGLIYVPSADESSRLQASVSSWLVAGDSATVARFSEAGWKPVPDGPVLTNDYSDLLRTLRFTGL